MTQEVDAERLARLTAEVQKAPKARHVYPPFVERRCADALRRGGTDREIIKRVKRSLHQVGGAYLTPAPRYARLLARLESANPGPHRDSLMRDIVGSHASMRERSGHLEDYYRALLAGIPTVEGGLTLLDLACGMNPLAGSMLPIAIDRYLACDVYLDMLDFVAEASALLDRPVETFPWDLVAGLPGPPADIVLLLKTLPCLDKLDPSAGQRLVASAATTCSHLLITYPIRSLGGADKGMRDHYAATFRSLIQRVEDTVPVELSVKPLELPAELGYRVTFSR